MPSTYSVQDIQGVQDIPLLVRGDQVHLAFGEGRCDGVYCGETRGGFRFAYSSGQTVFRVESDLDDLTVRDKTIHFNAVRHTPLTRGDPDRTLVEASREAGE